MRIENAQKTTTCIVDRRVLAEMLSSTAGYSYDYDHDRDRWRLIKALKEQVESGDRCAIYRSDWPTQAAGPGGSGRAGDVSENGNSNPGQGQGQDPLAALGLHPKVTSTLRRRGYNTVGDVLRLSLDDLMSVRNFGPKSLSELKRALKQHGFASPPAWDEEWFPHNRAGSE